MRIVAIGAEPRRYGRGSRSARPSSAHAVWHVRHRSFRDLLQDLAVRIVAGRAVEPVGTANLVRAGNLLELLHVAVAPVADPRRNRAEMVGVPRSEGRFFVGRLYPWRAEPLPPAAAASPGQRDRRRRWTDGCRNCATDAKPRNHRRATAVVIARRRRGRRSRRHVVVAAVAIDAGHLQLACFERRQRLPRCSCSLRGNAGRPPPAPPGRPT